jgi:uncharacterized secreted protein with C-terminal beta-propeller domain
VENASSTTPAVSSTEATDRLKQFSNYGELTSFLTANEAAVFDYYPAKVAQPNSSLSYFKDDAVSEEENLVKTATGFAYVLAKNDLLVLNLSGNSSAINKINFLSRPSGLFLTGNSLVVYGQDQQILESEIGKKFNRKNNYYFVKVFDLSDPANPREVRDLAFEGNYLQAFIKGDYFYFLTESFGAYQSGEPILPRVIDNGKVLSASCDGAEKCYVPGVFYFDSVYDSFRFFGATAINIKDNSEALLGQVYLLNGEQQVFVSGGDFYIAHSRKFDNQGLYVKAKQEIIYQKLNAEQQNKLKEIEALSPTILSVSAKGAKTLAVIDSYLNGLSAAERATLETSISDDFKNKLTAAKNFSAKTTIHKISVSGAQMNYFASVEVNGTIFNDFSFKSSDGYLYLATKMDVAASTESEAAKSYSSIYILDTNLKLIGKLENLATLEEIYGVRFLGKRAYLVTFKEDGSLFVISLDDKTKPEFSGTLKIPGLTNYLRPLDESGNKFLSLSYETETSAAVSTKKGLKLSLFDFTDLKNPKELSSYLIGDGNSNSPVFADPSAFFYSPLSNVSAVPISFASDGRLNFSGILTFLLEGETLTLKGQVDHSAGGFYNQVDHFAGLDYLNNTVKRSFYLNSIIYSFSNKFLKFGTLDALDKVSSWELSANEDDYLISSLGQASTNATTLATTVPAISPDAAETEPAATTP